MACARGRFVMSLFRRISKTLFPTVEVPAVVVFASGSKDGGGSGLLNLLYNIQTGVLNADIRAVVSNHANGGVRRIADTYKIPFEHLTKFDDQRIYRDLVQDYGATWSLLSGWLKFVRGLDPRHTINIHPGDVEDDRFSGDGMYGHHVHEAVLESWKRGDISSSYVSMHFVDEEAYDHGPAFFKYPISIDACYSPDDLAARVNKHEHCWQSFITNLVLSGAIRLVKTNGGWKVQVPRWYYYMPYCPKNSFIQSYWAA